MLLFGTAPIPQHRLYSNRLLTANAYHQTTKVTTCYNGFQQMGLEKVSVGRASEVRAHIFGERGDGGILQLVGDRCGHCGGEEVWWTRQACVRSFRNQNYQ